MPCRGPEEDYNYYAKKIGAENDRLTNMLCTLCGQLEEHFEEGPAATLIKGVPGLAKWWEDHKELDRKRRADERAAVVRARKKKAALDKLTDEEKQLLGLKK